MKVNVKTDVENNGEEYTLECVSVSFVNGVLICIDTKGKTHNYTQESLNMYNTGVITIM